VDGLWATKSEGVRLIVHAISFQDRQTDGHHAVVIPRFARKCIAW